MTAFDPKTAYADDFKFFDNTELADWEPDNQGLDRTSKLWREAIRAVVIRRGNVTHSDFASLAATVGISPATAAFLVTNPTDQDFKPRVNDVLKMDDGTNMMITGVESPVIGPWFPVFVQPERVNT